MNAFFGALLLALGVLGLIEARSVWDVVSYCIAAGLGFHYLAMWLTRRRRHG